MLTRFRYIKTALRLASFLSSLFFFLNNSIVNDSIIGTCGRVITSATNSGDKVNNRKGNVE